MGAYRNHIAEQVSVEVPQRAMHAPSPALERRVFRRASRCRSSAIVTLTFRHALHPALQPTVRPLLPDTCVNKRQFASSVT